MHASLRRTARGSSRGWPMAWSPWCWRSRSAEIERSHGGIAGARFAGPRLRQPRRRGTRLRVRPRSRVPLRRPGRCAFRRCALARCLALVRAPGAEDRRAARHRHGRGAPVRRRRAPAPGWREGIVGVEPAQLFRLPARARVDVGTPGAGARARRGGRCGAAGGLRTRARGHTGPPARAGHAAQRRRADAPAHARRTRPQRCGSLRPQAGRGWPGRPRIPVAVERARPRGKRCGMAWAARHAGPCCGWPATTG
jgi:hypothetical protein